MRSRTARVMTTLMRNGRDRRSENPSGPTRYLSACYCPGPISGSHQGQQPLRLHRDRGNPPSENRPYTWLHPNASQKVRFALAPRAPSIHGPSRHFAATQQSVAFGGKASVTRPAACSAGNSRHRASPAAIRARTGRLAPSRPRPRPSACRRQGGRRAACSQIAETSRPLAPHHSRQSRHDPSAKRPAERHEESPHKPNQ